MSLTHTQLLDFAARYTAAWCSHNPDRVAEFFAPNGSLIINSGTPSVGRRAIAAAVQSFMNAFPDLRVSMNDLRSNGSRVEYHWTLTGTNSEPRGTGRRVRISGFESWLFSPGDLIAESLGTFDANDYQRQLYPTV
jgi:uncharacterized protein (TIGR02246 family)